jgi:hypothetical protein
MVPDSQVVARPQAQYNYSIGDLGEYLKRLVEDFIPHSKQPLFQDYLASPIKLISFPRIQRDNMLAHAIFGHELGHPVAADYLAQESKDASHLATHPLIQQQVTKLVQKMLVGKNFDKAEELALATQVFDSILQIRKRALEELISDAVGIFIFGPSAFFAFYEFFWSGNWDDKPAGNEWYPPSRMRIRLMLDLMDTLNFTNEFTQIASTQNSTQPYVAAINAFFEEAKSLVAITDDQIAINADSQLKIAYDWMQASLDKAIAFAKAKTSSVTFQANIVFPQLPELIRRLELGVPPNEVGDPKKPQTVDYRASLLAAWMFKLRGVNPNSGEMLSSAEIDRLHKKTLSAIEYVILQDDYASRLAATSSVVGVT